MGLRTLVGVGFIHFVVVFSHRGYLRQVGDSDDLPALGHLFHDLCHLCRYVSAHTGVYLVKDDRRQTFGRGNQRLDTEHQTAYLTAGSHFAHSPQALVEVRRKAYLRFVTAVGRKVRSG